MSIEVTTKDIQKITGWCYDYARIKHQQWREQWEAPVIDLPLLFKKRYNRTFQTKKELEQYAKLIGIR